MWLNSLKDNLKKKKIPALHFGLTPCPLKLILALAAAILLPLSPVWCSILAKSFSVLTKASNMNASGKVIVWSRRFQNDAICLGLQAALCRRYAFGPYLLSMPDSQRHAVVVIPLSSLIKKRLCNINRYAKMKWLNEILMSLKSIAKLLPWKRKTALFILDLNL